MVCSCVNLQHVVVTILLSKFYGILVVTTGLLLGDNCPSCCLLVYPISKTCTNNLERLQTSVSLDPPLEVSLEVHKVAGNPNQIPTIELHFHEERLVGVGSRGSLYLLQIIRG